MSKFKKKKKGMPAVNTASLPDIVFMLLFFFMVTPTMRETSLQIEAPRLPSATEIKKLEHKSLVSTIYVGKAKDLKKRVSSYFTKTHDNGKTRVLVKKIVSIKHIVVDTETDALLLENNLIKKYEKTEKKINTKTEKK